MESPIHKAHDNVDVCWLTGEKWSKWRRQISSVNHANDCIKWTSTFTSVTAEPLLNGYAVKQPSPSLLRFHRLLLDRAFVDYFNVFLVQPIFSRRVCYKYSSKTFIFDPPLKNEHPETCNNDTMDWCRLVRFPVFSKTFMFLEYCLCCQLRQPYSATVLPFVIHKSIRDCDEWRVLVDNIIGTVFGMREFRRSLQAVKGEKLYQLWIDLERFRKLSMKDERRLPYFRYIREKYLMADSNYSLFTCFVPVDFKERDLALSQMKMLIPSDFNLETVSPFHQLQCLVINCLRNYWLPRHIILILSSSPKYVMERLFTKQEKQRVLRVIANVSSMFQCSPITPCMIDRPFKTQDTLFMESSYICHTHTEIVSEFVSAPSSNPSCKIHPYDVRFLDNSVSWKVNKTYLSDTSSYHSVVSQQSQKCASMTSSTNAEMTSVLSNTTHHIEEDTLYKFGDDFGIINDSRSSSRIAEYFDVNAPAASQTLSNTNPKKPSQLNSSSQLLDNVLDSPNTDSKLSIAKEEHFIGNTQMVQEFVAMSRKATKELQQTDFAIVIEISDTTQEIASETTKKVIVLPTTVNSIGLMDITVSDQSEHQLPNHNDFIEIATGLTFGDTEYNIAVDRDRKRARAMSKLYHDVRDNIREYFMADMDDETTTTSTSTELDTVADDRWTLCSMISDNCRMSASSLSLLSDFDKTNKYGKPIYIHPLRNPSIPIRFFASGGDTVSDWSQYPTRYIKLSMQLASDILMGGPFAEYLEEKGDAPLFNTLLFWQSLMDYRHHETDDYMPEQREKKAHSIVEKYLLPTSQQRPDFKESLIQRLYLAFLYGTDNKAFDDADTICWQKLHPAMRDFRRSDHQKFLAKIIPCFDRQSSNNRRGMSIKPRPDFFDVEYDEEHRDIHICGASTMMTRSSEDKRKISSRHIGVNDEELDKVLDDNVDEILEKIALANSDICMKGKSHNSDNTKPEKDSSSGSISAAAKNRHSSVKVSGGKQDIADDDLIKDILIDDVNKDLLGDDVNKGLLTDDGNKDLLDKDLKNNVCDNMKNNMLGDDIKNNMLSDDLSKDTIKSTLTTLGGLDEIATHESNDNVEQMSSLAFDSSESQNKVEVTKVYNWELDTEKINELESDNVKTTEKHGKKGDDGEKKHADDSSEINASTKPITDLLADNELSVNQDNACEDRVYLDEDIAEKNLSMNARSTRSLHFGQNKDDRRYSLDPLLMRAIMRKESYKNNNLLDSSSNVNRIRSVVSLSSANRSDMSACKSVMSKKSVTWQYRGRGIRPSPPDTRQQFPPFEQGAYISKILKPHTPMIKNFMSLPVMKTLKPKLSPSFEELLKKPKDLPVETVGEVIEEVWELTDRHKSWALEIAILCTLNKYMDCPINVEDLLDFVFCDLGSLNKSRMDNAIYAAEHGHKKSSAGAVSIPWNEILNIHPRIDIANVKVKTDSEYIRPAVPISFRAMVQNMMHTEDTSEKTGGDETIWALEYLQMHRERERHKQEKLKKPVNLAHCLNDKQQYDNFHKYLLKHNNVTPLRFLMAVQEMKEQQTYKSQMSQARSISRTFLHKRTNPGLRLQCSDEIIQVASSLKNPSPAILVSCQQAVYKSLERKWFNRYQNLFADDEDESSDGQPCFGSPTNWSSTRTTPNPDPENRYVTATVPWLIQQRIPDTGNTSTKILWKKFVVQLKEFSNGLLKNQQLLSLFYLYIRTQIKRLSIDMISHHQTQPVPKLKVHMAAKSAVDKKFNHHGVYPDVPVIINNKSIILNKVVQDVEFWIEVRKYKDLYESVRGDLGTFGFIHPKDESTIRTKGTAIVTCFLQSEVPPKIRINLPNDLATNTINLMDNQFLHPLNFHEAYMHIMPNVLQYWCRFVAAWDPLRLNRTELIRFYDIKKHEYGKHRVNESPHGSVIMPDYKPVKDKDISKKKSDDPRIEFTEQSGVVYHHGGPVVNSFLGRNLHRRFTKTQANMFTHFLHQPPDSGSTSLSHTVTNTHSGSQLKVHAPQMKSHFSKRKVVDTQRGSNGVAHRSQRGGRSSIAQGHHSHASAMRIPSFVTSQMQKRSNEQVRYWVTQGNCMEESSPLLSDKSLPSDSEKSCDTLAAGDIQLSVSQMIRDISQRQGCNELLPHIVVPP